MYPQQKQKQGITKQEEDFEIQQQINLYRNQLPQIPRTDSHFFFKEIVRQQSQAISYVQIGFRVASLSPNIYDIANVVINDIHCNSQDNFKLIIDGDELWITSTLVYPFALLGDLNYNIMEAHSRDSLVIARQIMQKIIKRCNEGYSKMQNDEQIIKEVRKIAKNLKKAFKDPNSDY